MLGDIEARAGGRRIDVGPGRQQCVLAALLVDANRPVPVDQLLDRVWGDRPPRQARDTLYSYLSRLRHLLTRAHGPGIARRPGGYLVEVDPMAVDLHRFRALVDRARTAGEPAALLDEALDLWRADALGTLDTPWANQVRETLHGERRSAELDRTDLALAAGRHAELLAQLCARADRYPLDERLAGQLMLALYRCGRQADGLGAYERTRRTLAAELGVDPSPPLRELYQRILGGDPRLAVRAPAMPPAVPCQLPPAPMSFAGRTRQLTELSEALAGPTATAALGGTGGMGKTWLAVRWAHDNLARFPDGQLYLNLRGYDPCAPPVPPAEALRGLLDGLGVDPAAIPVEPDRQAAQYRRLLAGRRMLILLDNARDTNQVAPLLPGSPGCTVLVTSRYRLGGLVAAHGARPLTVHALSEAEARQVLAGHLGPARIAQGAAAVAGLVAHCAGLPLALGIVAARAAAQPELPLAALAEELAAARLDALDAGEVTVNLRAVLSCSVDALNPPAARMFALLGRAPGPDVSLAAAASLAGLPPAPTRLVLRELANAHLVDEPAPGRYRMHDLVRLFAAEQPGDPAGDPAAVVRVLDHYLHTAVAADRLLAPQRPPLDIAAAPPEVTVAEIPDDRQALAWFTASHPALLAAVRAAAQRGLDPRTWQLAWALTTFLVRCNHWHDAVEVHETALAAVLRRGDVTAEAQVRRSLANAYTYVGRNADAERHFADALALCTAAGDRPGRADAHRGLARAHARRQCFHRALDHADQALALYRDAGDRCGEAAARNAIGWFHAQLGDLPRALWYCRQAAHLHQENADPHKEAATLDSLGYIHHRLGDPRTAVSWYQRACVLFHQVGDRYEEAGSLVGFGDAQADAGDPAGARASWQRALDLFEHLDPAEADRIRARLEYDSGGEPADHRVPEHAGHSRDGLVAARALPADRAGG